MLMRLKGAAEEKALVAPVYTNLGDVANAATSSLNRLAEC
jgi:hypothetical protein